MCGMIIWLSPVQNGNNPLNEHEKRAYRCKSAVYSIIGVILSCLFAWMKLPSYRYSINMAMMSVFILQMVGMVKYSQMKGEMDFGFDSAYATCNAWDDDGNHSAITLYE